MEISFRQKKLGKQCSSSTALKKAFGDRSRKLMIRLALLSEANNLDDVPKGPPERLHALKHERVGQYAVVIKDNWRLVFVPENEPLPIDEDGQLILSKVTKIQILEVVDYHN